MKTERTNPDGAEVGLPPGPYAKGTLTFDTGKAMAIVVPEHMTADEAEVARQYVASLYEAMGGDSGLPADTYDAAHQTLPSGRVLGVYAPEGMDDADRAVAIESIESLARLLRAQGPDAPAAPPPAPDEDGVAALRVVGAAAGLPQDDYEIVRVTLPSGRVAAVVTPRAISLFDGVLFATGIRKAADDIEREAGRKGGSA